MNEHIQTVRLTDPRFYTTSKSVVLLQHTTANASIDA